jgi:hypothetical protein
MWDIGAWTAGGAGIRISGCDDGDGTDSNILVEVSRGGGSSNYDYAAQYRQNGQIRHEGGIAVVSDSDGSPAFVLRESPGDGQWDGWSMLDMTIVPRQADYALRLHVLANFPDPDHSSGCCITASVERLG